MSAFFYSGLSVQNRRKTNMDSVLLNERFIDGNAVCFAVVCDGVGSMENGGYAAAAAAHQLNQWFDQIEDYRRIGLRLRDAVLEINRRIVSDAGIHQLRTAATLSALLLDRERYYIVHVGDSRIYSLDNETLEQLTCDHVSSEGRLTSYIGRKEEIAVDYNEGRQCGQLFLLCSDGLYKRMDPGFCHSCLAKAKPGNMEEIMRELISYVIKRGETDNISLALVKGRIQ